MIRLRCRQCGASDPHLYAYDRTILCPRCLRRARSTPQALLRRLTARLWAIWQDLRQVPRL